MSVARREVASQVWTCPNVCCQSDKKQRKNRRPLEKTIRYTWDCTPATLVNAARIRHDERVLLEIRDADLHAKDILYLYYASPRRLDLLVKKELRAEEVDATRPHQRAFLRLAGKIEENMQVDPSFVTSSSELLSEYKGFLHEEGVEETSYLSHLLKGRLSKHFANQLTFHRPQRKNEAQFVFSSKLSPGPLIESVQMQLRAEEQKADDMIACRTRGKAVSNIVLTCLFCTELLWS